MYKAIPFTLQNLDVIAKEIGTTRREINEYYETNSYYDIHGYVVILKDLEPFKMTELVPVWFLSNQVMHDKYFFTSEELPNSFVDVMLKPTRNKSHE